MSLRRSTVGIVALLGAFSDRPWIAGMLTWAYEMIDRPLATEDGVRSRLAEAVLAKWYGRLT